MEETYHFTLEEATRPTPKLTGKLKAAVILMFVSSVGGAIFNWLIFPLAGIAGLLLFSRLALTTAASRLAKSLGIMQAAALLCSALLVFSVVVDGVAVVCVVNLLMCLLAVMQVYYVSVFVRNASLTEYEKSWTFMLCAGYAFSAIWCAFNAVYPLLGIAFIYKGKLIMAVVQAALGCLTGYSWYVLATSPAFSAYGFAVTEPAEDRPSGNPYMKGMAIAGLITVLVMLVLAAALFSFDLAPVE